MTVCRHRIIARGWSWFLTGARLRVLENSSAALKSHHGKNIPHAAIMLLDIGSFLLRFRIRHTSAPGVLQHHPLRRVTSSMH